MLIGQLALLLVLLPVCCFAPGFFVIRRLRWNPLEKLCGSIGLSLLLLYLVCWAIYCLTPRGDNIPIHAAPFFAISIICLGLAIASWKDVTRLMGARTVRRALTGFAFLLLFTAVSLAIIRVYSGGGWFADWLEHFQRTLFFLRHFPADTPIFPMYVIPSRPPMVNVLAAFFLAQTADRFELFQVVFVFFNLLLFLPCYLIMPALGRRAKRRTALLVLLFASSPVLMQNIDYTWTKAATGFYVVLAIWLYLAGWRKRDTLRTTAAFVALAVGLLIHYSAGPYVVILTLHYLLAVFPRRPNKWRELATIGVICGALVGTWLIWSWAVYGSQITFASNTTVTSSKAYQGDPVEKIALNIFDSIVPAFLRDPSIMGDYDKQRRAGAVRDWFFAFYQVNVIFGMGLIGGPLALWLGFRELTRRRARKRRTMAVERNKRGSPAPADPPRQGPVPERRFWLILIFAGLILGIAVVGERDALGSAHLTLLSLQAIGVTMIAAVVPWRPGTLAVLVLAGCALDFSAGVLLQVHVESLENTPWETVFPNVVFEDGQIVTALPGPGGLSHSCWDNWFIKHQLAIYDDWRRMLVEKNGSNPAFQAVLPAYEEKAAKEKSVDALAWHNWFARNGGATVFLGDHIAGANQTGTKVATCVLIALFLGILGFAFPRRA